jgi:hypothetical protein
MALQPYVVLALATALALERARNRLGRAAGDAGDAADATDAAALAASRCVERLCLRL